MVEQLQSTNNKVKSNGKFILSIFLAAVVLVLCTAAVLIRDCSIAETDAPYHIMRIQGIANALRAGHFPVKYYSNFYNGAGYMSPIFYGDLFLYLPAVLLLLGVPINIAFTIFNYTMLAAIAISMYFLIKKFISNRVMCVIGATMFAVSQYVFCDIFYRGAVGESLAIIFFIWLTIGIINMLNEGYTKPWILSIAFLGFLYSHMTSLIIAAVLVVIVVLFNCKKLFPQKSFWIKSLLAIAIFVGVGAYNLISFVEMYFSDKYAISHPWIVPSQATMPIAAELGISFFGIGAICILPFFLRLCIKKNENNAKTLKLVHKLFIISIIFIFLTCKLFPWKFLDNIFGFIQFPWRLNIFPSIMLVLAATLELNIIYTEGIGGLKTILISLLLFVVPFNNFYLMHFNDYDYNSKDEGLIFEWVPLEVADKRGALQTVDFDITLQDENNNEIVYTRKPYDTAVTFTSDENSNYYAVPIIYYKGFAATIKLADGTTKDLSVSQNKQNGKVMVQTGGLKGEVFVYYKGTTLQKLGLLATVASCVSVVVGGVVYICINNKRKKTLTQNKA